MKEKIIYLVLFASLAFSCQEEPINPTWSKFSLSDSTFRKKIAVTYFDSVISVGSELQLRPLNQLNGEAVRVRNMSGWGTFDAIATIYRDEHCNIQMIKQNPGRGLFGKKRGFQIQEYTLPFSHCDSIFEMINNDNFHRMPFDLEPDRTLIDGNIYSIAYQGFKTKHVVTWQLFHREMYDVGRNMLKLEKKEAEKIYHDIFLLARRPLPCIYFFFHESKQDSFVYLPKIREGYDFIESIKYTCPNCNVKRSRTGQDTVIIKSNYDGYGHKILDISPLFITTEGIKKEGTCIEFIDPEEYE